MPELSESIAAIKDSPREDRFTYLTILQYHVLTPEVLPTLNEVLEQDAQLTQEIGWDLVQMLLKIEGSETCLETVARLGNPREVILKVMEALESMSETSINQAAALALGGDAPVSDTQSSSPERFIILLGMLAILHRRLKTKRPSAFLGASLVKVFGAYQPTPQMTASVINLVRSLSGQKRPPIPTRSSSVHVLTLGHDGDTAKNAPDPEEEQVNPTEDGTQQKLLQAFVTCILERYVDENEMQWSPRLLEHHYPEKVPPHKKSVTQSFGEQEELRQRDAIVGQLVALARDLGLVQCDSAFVKSIYDGAAAIDPLLSFEDFTSTKDIHFSPGGVVSLIAYWIFSTDLFEADNPQPKIHIFPELVRLVEYFLGTSAQDQINIFPGIADALLAIGFGLDHRKLVSASNDTEPSFMAFHHHLTLISVFHPNLQVRNAATTFAGVILHQDPDDGNRLEILEDLLENCMFPSLKACAVSWLKEEMMLARKAGTTDASFKSQFTSPDTLERIQYFIFPDSLGVRALSNEQFAEYWAQNGVYLLQVANFAFFLFSGYGHLVPAGMAAAVEERFVNPLAIAAQKLVADGASSEPGHMDLSVFADRLQAIPFDKFD